VGSGRKTKSRISDWANGKYKREDIAQIRAGAQFSSIAIKKLPRYILCGEGSPQDIGPTC
jgi:hypothetical protein